MKRTLRRTIGLLALAGLLTAAAGAQSLGEYARQQRAKQGPTPAGVKEYTNDNLPTSGAMSEVGPATPAPSPASARASAAAEKAEKASAEERKKLEAELKAKLTEQGKNIDRLQRELDALVQEQKLAQAAYWHVPPNLQNPRQFADEEQQRQTDISDKQKALDEAKKTLEDMKEQLRKAGFPSS